MLSGMRAQRANSYRLAKRRAKRVCEEPVAYAAERAGIVVMPWSTLEAGERYVEKLKARAKAVSETLGKAGIPHAVVGGLSVAAHVAQVDETAVRNTRDLDLLLNRSDLGRASEALEPLGYMPRKVMGLMVFVPKSAAGRKRLAEGIHIVFAKERVRPEYICPAPALAEDAIVQAPEGYACLTLRDVVRMKLTSYRLKDQVHIQDLLEMRLISGKVRKSLEPELRARLEQVEETTERERLR